MPDELHKEQLTDQRSVGERAIIDETVSARMMQIVGKSNQYVPTQAQVDKILEMQEKGMDYTHDERTKWSPRQKKDLLMFIITIFVFVGIFIFSVFYVKEYLGEIVAGMISFLTGGIGGYGLAKSKSKSATDEG